MRNKRKIFRPAADTTFDTRTAAAGVATPTEHALVEPPARDWLMVERQLLKDLKISPDLEKAIETTCKLHRLRSARAKARAEEELKLRYYYGGKSVVCVKTAGGLVVVAAATPGASEPRRVLDALPPNERRNATVYSPDPWDERDFIPVTSLGEQ